ncbi:hypothetical protein N7454_009414 [Penicillium verhagenii]|nr:hypothetical protein N7454_009414 [Penicillium verhagenii]
MDENVSESEIEHLFKSKNAYEFHVKDIDDIFRVTTTGSAYLRDVISFSHETHESIRHSILTDFQQTSDVELGPLDRMPLEAWHEIVTYLDMKSIFKFRQASRRSRQLVDSFYQYRRVASHGLDLLCAIFRTGLATDVSIVDFHRILCANKCEFCRKFGAYVIILPWKRSCFECIRGSNETRMLTVTSAERKYPFTEDQLAKLKSFKSLPGRYDVSETMYEDRIELTNLREVSVALGTDVKCREMARWEYLAHPWTFMGSCHQPCYDDQTGRAQSTFMCMGCSRDSDSMLFFDSPWWSSPWRSIASNKGHEYGPNEFLGHFTWCKAAQILWEKTVEEKS